jgi:predicted transcriptional regulator
MIHKGEIIEKAVRKTGYPITLLAKRLGKSRRHVYNLFSNRDVSIEVILEIGKIIQYDFSEDINGLSKIPENYKIDVATEPFVNFEDANYWKSKYFELLDIHHLLLKKEFEKYFLNEKGKK